MYYNSIGQILSLAGGAGSRRGTGGMKTKLRAARLAAAQGIDTVVTNGKRPEALYEILEGKSVGTLFAGKRCQEEKRKRRGEKMFSSRLPGASFGGLLNSVIFSVILGAAGMLPGGRRAVDQPIGHHSQQGTEKYVIHRVLLQEHGGEHDEHGQHH